MGLQALSVWTLLWLLALSDAVPYEKFAFPIDYSLFHNYTRLTEIKKHCNSFISSASELHFDDNLASKLKNKLSFFNGDWEQDFLGATLMPFDDSDMPHATSSFISPWKVVSFEVKNVSSSQSQYPKNTIPISGVLSIGITRNSILVSEPFLKFYKRPGMSALRVDFEGLYIETEGESLVCLLGNSTFPFKKVPTRFSDDDDDITSYFNVRDMYNEEHVILPHTQILLVLKYPKTLPFSMNRIHGEMISLNQREDFEYFDKVHITSNLGIFHNNHLSSTSKDLSFNQNPLQDAMEEDGVNKFHNSEFCKILKFLEHKAYRVMPNLKLGGQNGFQDTVGPFILGTEIQIVDRNNENLRIIMQSIICKEGKVSGVLRMYPATMDPHVAARRTSLSTLTLSVKGTWDSSNGLLSMTGCLGPTLVKCETGVLLYFPKSFSSKQRSVVSGSIFSLKSDALYHPVFIGLEMLNDGDWYSSVYLSYNYSKRDLAIEFKERFQEYWLLSYIRKSLFRYPALEEEKDGIFKVSNRLSNDLRIDTFSSFETFVRVEVLSLERLFRTNGSHSYELPKCDVLNISMSLYIIEAPRKIKEESYQHVSKLYLEGLYDQSVGKLYLIGCRKVSFDHVDLERGLDCLIEVGIEYSSLNTRWLINPTAKITIVSQRNEDDIYHFKPIRLHTFILHDKSHEKNVIFREIFEGYFRVLLLLVFIVHILNQIKNMRTSTKPVAYISLVMLSIWIIGYGIRLIYGKQIVIISSETQYYKNQRYDHQPYKRYLNTLDYLARFLVLVSIFLMAKISHMVLKARKALKSQGESTPSEKKVIVVSLCFYMCYLFLIMVERGLWLYLNPLQGASTKDLYVKLIMDVLRYEVFKLQDYFMFPQITAFYIWKLRPSDHRLGSFLIGIWIPSVFLFVYEIVRDPVDFPVIAHDIVL